MNNYIGTVSNTSLSSYNRSLTIVCLLAKKFLCLYSLYIDFVIMIKTKKKGLASSSITMCLLSDFLLSQFFL